MEKFYASTLENLEKTFMPHTSEYQRYIDFQTMREMKQVIKGKLPVYYDLQIKELVEMNMRYILDGYWNDVFFTAVIPTSDTFRPTIEVYGKPAQTLLSRFEMGKDKAFHPTYVKEEFTRRIGLRDRLRDFSKALYTYLDSYVERNENVEEKTNLAETVLEGWEFPFLQNHPDLQKEWVSLQQRTVEQFKRMEELDIEEQHSLETMMNKDVPNFIASFQQLPDITKEDRKDELLHTMHDLRTFIETLERKEEESYTQNFARSKGIISSKYNKEDEDFFSQKSKDV